jgi:superfamily II DNA or RNA helicase
VKNKRGTKKMELTAYAKGETDKNFKLYWYQEEAVKKVTKDHVKLVALLMSVGSGKTNVAFELFAEYIESHKNEKTFQTFVCPRLKLCKQQAIDLADYIRKAGLKDVVIYMYNSYGKDVVYKWVENGINHEDRIKRFDKNQKEFPTNQHVIFIACAASLWNGLDDVKKFEYRLKENEKSNRLNGFIVYDEAHNYGADENEASKTAYTYGNDKENPSGFAQYFETSVFMSGTPSDYMKDIATRYSFSCHCAVQEKKIFKPTLNLIVDPNLYTKGNFSIDEDLENVSEKRFASAIVKMVEKEKENNKDSYGVRSLICIPPRGTETSGRNTIVNTVESLKKENYNIITLLSEGPAINKDGDEVNLDCCYKLADSTKIEHSNEAFVMTMLENIDGIENVKMDDLEDDEIEAVSVLKKMHENKQPIVVFQIDKISEGVNICSFNSVLITSKRASKQLQQSARAFRKYPNKKSANVYCLSDSVVDLRNLATGLFEKGLEPGDINWGFVSYIGGSGSTKGEAKFNEWTSIIDDEMIIVDVMPNGEKFFEVERNLNRDETVEKIIKAIHSNKSILESLKSFNEKPSLNKEEKKRQEVNKQKLRVERGLKNITENKKSEDYVYIENLIRFVTNILAGNDEKSKLNRELWKAGYENLVLNRVVNNGEIAGKLADIFRSVK